MIDIEPSRADSNDSKCYLELHPKFITLSVRKKGTRMRETAAN